MRWILNYWIPIVVAVVSIGAGVGLAMWSSNSHKPPRATLPANNDVLPEYTTGVGDNLSNLVSPLIPSTNSQVKPGTYPTPLPLPSNQVPWETGPSSPTVSPTQPSTGGSIALPDNTVPWGTGPSQQ